MSLQWTFCYWVINLLHIGERLWSINYLVFVEAFFWPRMWLIFVTVYAKDVYQVHSFTYSNWSKFINYNVQISVFYEFWFAWLIL